MTHVTVEDVPSTPYRLLKVLLLAFPVAGGAFALLSSLTLLSADPTNATATLLVGGLYLAALLVGALLSLVIPVLLYVDAEKLGDQPIDWEPNPVLYALGGFFLTGLVVLHYLYVRAEHVVDRVDWGGWWLVVLATSLGAVVLSVAAAFLPAGALFGFAALALVPVGVYFDTTYVRLQTSEWQPNPVTQYTVAAVSALFVLLLPFYLVYYLYRRSTSVGLALP